MDGRSNNNLKIYEGRKTLELTISLFNHVSHNDNMVGGVGPETNRYR